MLIGKAFLRNLHSNIFKLILYFHICLFARHTIHLHSNIFKLILISAVTVLFPALFTF